MVDRFVRGTGDDKRRIYTLYFDYIDFVNNWHLVDCSAHRIVGVYLEHRSKRPLPRDAANDAALCDREIPRTQTQSLPRRTGSLIAGKMTLCLRMKLSLGTKSSQRYYGAIIAQAIGELGNRLRKLRIGPTVTQIRRAFLDQLCAQ